MDSDYPLNATLLSSLRFFAKNLAFFAVKKNTETAENTKKYTQRSRRIY